jgi:hypothetical protein
MKTTQSPAPDEKNSPPAAAQTVFHLLANPAYLFSARFFRGGLFFFKTPTKQLKQTIVDKFFMAELHRN